MPISNTEPVEVALKMSAALDWARANDEEAIRPHYLAALEQLTAEVKPNDLTTSELVSLVALLIPAHSRVLGWRGRLEPTTPPTAKILNLVRDGDAAG